MIQSNYDEELLRCPRCRSRLSEVQDKVSLVKIFQCTAIDDHKFPIIHGIPILINDDNSVFRIEDFKSPAVTGKIGINRDVKNTGADDQGYAKSKSTLRRLYLQFAKKLQSFHVIGPRITLDDALQTVKRITPNPKVLVVGAGERRINLIEENVIYTDVLLDKGIEYVCDAHDLPFPDEVFDFVIAQAVLEHVADPWRVALEIHRVLKPRGYVFATTPFLQPIHMGAYDFTRFTLAGYRRLFRYFDEIELVAAYGPGSSLAYAIQYFLASFASRKPYHAMMNFLGLLISRPFKILDKVLLNQKAALAFAAGYLFFGVKADKPLSDREVVEYIKTRLTIS